MKLYKVILPLVAAMLLIGCGTDKDSERKAYKQYGINCIESGDYDEAIKAFQSALDQSVGSVGAEELDIVFYKAQAQYLSGDVDAALESYTAIIDYNGDSGAYYLRGNLYFALGDSEAGIKDFDEAIKGDSKNYEIYIGVYNTLHNYGMDDKASEYIQAVFDIKGDSAQDLLGKGRAYECIGDIDQAESNFKSALEKGEPNANYYLGQLYVTKGDAQTSQQYFDAFLEEVDADSYALCEMGRSQLELGNFDTAISFFETALEDELVPNKQAILKHMIIAYEYSGRFDEAKTAMKEYLELYPNDEDAIREQQFLETR